MTSITTDPGLSSSFKDQDDFMNEMDNLMTLMEGTNLNTNGPFTETIDSFTLNDEDLLVPLNENDMLPMNDDEMAALADTLTWESEDDDTNDDHTTHPQSNPTTNTNQGDTKTNKPTKSNTYKPLRFAIGDRVECKGPNEIWHIGTIDDIHYRDEFWPKDQFVPYAVQIDQGEVLYAPNDDNRIIRAITTTAVAAAATTSSISSTTKSIQKTSTDTSNHSHQSHPHSHPQQQQQQQHGHSHGGVPCDGNHTNNNEVGLFTQEELAALLSNMEAVSNSSNSNGHGHSHGGVACDGHHGHPDNHPEENHHYEKPVHQSHGHSHGGVACDGHHGHPENHHEGHGHSHGDSSTSTKLRPRMIHQDKDAPAFDNLDQLNAMMERVHDVMAAGGEVDQTKPAYRDPKTGSVFVTTLDKNSNIHIEEIKLTDRPSPAFENASRLAEEEKEKESNKEAVYDRFQENGGDDEDEECVIM